MKLLLDKSVKLFANQTQFLSTIGNTIFQFRFYLATLSSLFLANPAQAAALILTVLLITAHWRCPLFFLLNFWEENLTINLSLMLTISILFYLPLLKTHLIFLLYHLSIFLTPLYLYFFTTTTPLKILLKLL